MRGALLAVGLLAACGRADPCAEAPGTCLAIHVVGARGVPVVDELYFSLCGAAADSYSQPLARTPLPVALVYQLPARAVGHTTVHVVGLRGGRTIAHGAADVELAVGKRLEVTIHLSSVEGGAPIITCVSPDRGPTTGGTSLVLSGANFRGDKDHLPTVSIGGAVVPAQAVARLSEVQITAFLPGSLHGVGPARVAVTNPDGPTGAADGLFAYYPGQVVFATGVSAGAGYAAVLAVGDWNGDGKADVATADGDELNLFTSRGDGRLDVGAAIVVDPDLGAIAAADLNGDGRIDLALTSRPSNRISTLTNRGDGTFADPRAWDTGLTPALLALADVDGSGSLDLITGNLGEKSLSLLLGRGEGSFAPPPRRVDLASWPGLLAAGDLDGDGRADVVLALADEPQLRSRRSRGDGTFEVDRAVGLDRLPSSLALADFTGDGALDAVVVSLSDGSVRVFRGDGDGTFAPTAMSTPEHDKVGMSHLIVGDWNNDHRPDVAVGRDGGGVALFIGVGDGTFDQVWPFGGGTAPCYDLGGGDFNGDGLLDLVVLELSADVNKTAQLTVLLNTSL